MVVSRRNTGPAVGSKVRRRPIACDPSSMTPDAFEESTLERTQSPGPAVTEVAPRASRRRRLAWLIGLIALVILIGAGVHLRLASRASMQGRLFAMAGPLPVSVARATTANVPVVIEALGTVTPLSTVDVRPQVSGPIIKLPFHEGERVAAGALLAQIDPRPYKAALDQAQAQLERDRAALALARIDLARYKRLLAQDSIAEQTYADQAGTVNQDAATVDVDKAAVETAKLNLSYCYVKSPIAGRVGLRQVDLGNLVQANQTQDIVAVTQMQPMSVVFSVPQADLAGIFRQMSAGHTLVAQAYSENMKSLIATGTLSSIDNQINTATGTLQMRALFGNRELQLFPQEFVNIKLVVDTLRNQVVVPGAAVQNGPSSNFVFIVRPDDTVTMRTVKTGPTFGNDITILSGLAAGETVVTDGADQLRDGAHVRIPGQKPASAAAGAGAASAGSSNGRCARIAAAAKSATGRKAQLLARLSKRFGCARPASAT
jgi:multidrug efflux system membrane fusion protein